jgi:hypothetical protein
MASRDLSYTPKLPGEIDKLAEISSADLVHAQETADANATPKLNELLHATKDEEDRAE